MPVPKRKRKPNMSVERAKRLIDNGRCAYMEIIKPWQMGERTLSFKQIQRGFSSIELLPYTKEYSYYLGSLGDDYTLWESYQYILLACGTDIQLDKPFDVNSNRYKIWRTVMLNFIRQNINKLPATREERINREEGQTVKGNAYQVNG